MSARERMMAWMGGCLLALGACSSDSEGDGGASGGTGGGGSTVTPPDNIDVTSCATIVDPSGTDPACASCCQATAFPASSFINEDRCTCGRARNDGRDTVCATPELAATPNTCTDCCSGAGFLSSSWQGGGVAVDSTCACRNARNATICQSALAAADGSAACRRCCLEQGFLGSSYVGAGAAECACLSP